MPRPTAPRDLILKRRELVATARLRGLTVRETKIFLEAQGIKNPQTGKPFNLGTNHRDLVELTDEWKATAAGAIDDHKARILAELLEVKRAAWQKKNFTAIIQCLERECKILGIDSPQVIKVLTEHAEFKEWIFTIVDHLPDEIREMFYAPPPKQLTDK